MTTIALLRRSFSRCENMQGKITSRNSWTISYLLLFSRRFFSVGYLLIENQLKRIKINFGFFSLNFTRILRLVDSRDSFHFVFQRKLFIIGIRLTGNWKKETDEIGRERTKKNWTSNKNVRHGFWCAYNMILRSLFRLHPFVVVAVVCSLWFFVSLVSLSCAVFDLKSFVFLFSRHLYTVYFFTFHFAPSIHLFGCRRFDHIFVHISFWLFISCLLFRIEFHLISFFFFLCSHANFYFSIHSLLLRLQWIIGCHNFSNV